MNEDSIIALAIEQSSRKRYRTQLASPKKRFKTLDKLNHNPPLDSRYTKWFPSFQKALESINVDPVIEVCILSAAKEIDGKMMSLKKAIQEVPFYGWGTIIGITKDLALYYGETGERAAVIHRKQIYNAIGADGMKIAVFR